MAAAAANAARIAEKVPRDLTLLELVQAVSEVAETEHEVVATVLHLLRSRRVKLCGNFRGAPPRDFS